MHSKFPFLAAALSLAFAGCDFLPFSSDPEGGQAAASDGAAPDDFSASASLAPLGAPVLDDGVRDGMPKLTGDPIVWRSDLESESPSCWGARNGSGYALSACGEWGGIGSRGARLADDGVSHSGSKALAFTYERNEDVAGAALTLSANVVNVRAYYYFAPGYDFGQGVKIARVQSFNEATQMNDIDIVATVRSNGSVNQCGVTEMSDMGLFFNGRPVGFDWGNLTVPVNFQRGRWYAVEYQVFLNTPGRRDGWVKIWVDGVEVGSKTGIDIRGKGGWNVKLNRIRVGGWYSNSAHGNPCANPDRPSTMYVDDVAVGTWNIGL